MFSLTFWSTKTVVTTSEALDNSLPSDTPVNPSSSLSALSLPEKPRSTTEDDSNALSQRGDSVQPTEETSSTSTPSTDPQQLTTATSTNFTTLEAPEPRLRKISIRSSLSLLRRPIHQHQQRPMLDAAHVQRKKHGIVCDLKRAIRVRTATGSKSERRAKESAEIVRALIIGPGSISPASKSQALSKVQLEKVKSQLAKPKSANKLIFQLRNLDLATNLSAPLPVAGAPGLPTGKGRGPIHAVCLDKTDEDVEKHHFARLKPDAPLDTTALFADSIVTAGVDSISSTLGNLHIVDLVGTDFGFGQPITGQGIFAGAVPTAEAVITGIRLITPQLMSLGYITGQAIFPDHTGVYPPIDRMSILTYWWGFELVLPPPTLVCLQRAQSISKTVVNLLTAMSAVNNGVREILPFIRYISQFLEFEFGTILAQDQGLGVVCAATWIMPAALVPRPWDFDLPPGTPNLIPHHDAGPLEQLPPHEGSEDGPGRPSGELPPISSRIEVAQTSPPPDPDNSVPDNDSIPPPSVTIVPPTLRGLPLTEVQLQA